MINRHHHPQDRQSLLMHQEAVRMLEADPSLTERLLAILAHWDTHVSCQSKPLRDRWVQIILERDWAAALAESERGNQLRQASPLACLLPNKVRLDIIQTIRREKDEAAGEMPTYSEFIRRGIAAINRTVAAGDGIPAEVVIAKLEAKLADVRRPNSA